jgi:hypothetical protein
MYANEINYFHQIFIEKNKLFLTGIFDFSSKSLAQMFRDL